MVKPFGNGNSRNHKPMAEPVACGYGLQTNSAEGWLIKERFFSTKHKKVADEMLLFHFRTFLFM
jgi:hypothetical protein